jgi:uroporphyrinogen-III decarboxylase
MAGRLTCYERVEKAWNLQKADRVPVAPMVIYILPYLAGLSFKEMIENPERLAQAAIDNRELVGDFIHPVLTILDHQAVLPNSTWDQVSIDWRIYEDFPPRGNIPSAFFDKDMIGSYDGILERGFAPVLFNRKLNKSVFQRGVDDWLYYGFEYPHLFWRAWHRFVRETGKCLQMGARAVIPFDALIHYRTFELITEDVIERPEKVKQVCEVLGRYEILNAMGRCMVAGAGEVPGAEKIFLGNGMGAPPYVSPRIFNEFVYPYLKMQVDIAVNRGFKVHVHLDGDLTLVLDTLSKITDDLPTGMVMLDFEKTDMKKAKEVLGDKVCIYGNVPAALMVYGTDSEVISYCRKLIEDCADGGGFILGSECEVPWDAKPENVRAMIDAAEEYGRYS